jgi:hypothetical protein
LISRVISHVSKFGPVITILQALAQIMQQQPEYGQVVSNTEVGSHNQLETVCNNRTKPRKMRISFG